jgi:nicotinate-nucleotide pyrophosphorylase (carboxylating)
MTIDEIIKRALEEDIGSGDHTSLATVPESALGRSKLLVKEQGIIAGVSLARKIFSQYDPSLDFRELITDGAPVAKGDIAFYVSGSSRSILGCERIVLNFMQRMSGIATATRELAVKIEGTKAIILDTRKTTPLLRQLEKEAVRLGGGQNHRMGLYDMIMIKDNHVDFAGGIKQAISEVSRYISSNNGELKLKIEIEVRNFEELEQVMETGGIDRIMLDNFSPENLAKAVRIIDGRYETEASGGINSSNIRQYAETGVDFISIGAITHHIRSLDMSLKAVL